MQIRQQVKIVTHPTLEPIELSQALAWLREDGNDRDAIVQELIRAAREEVENETGRATMTATYRDALDRFPVTTHLSPIANLAPQLQPTSDAWPWQVAPWAISLMRSPVVAVSSIQYYDPDGTLQTLDAERYHVDTTMDPGRVAPAAGFAWPATQITRPGAVRITYTAGHGTTAADRRSIPAPMMQAMRMLIAHWHENPEAVITGTISKEIERGVDALLSKVRVTWNW